MMSDFCNRRCRAFLALCALSLALLAACSAPAAAPPATATATLGAIVRPTATLTPLATRVLPPTITLSPSPSPLPSATPFLYGIVQAQRSVSLYSGPGEEYFALALLLPAERVRLHGRDESGAWFFVQLQDGRSGWVSADLLQSAEATESTPSAVDPTVTALPPAAPAPQSGASTSPDDLPVIAAPPPMPTAGPPITTPGETPAPASQQQSALVFALCDSPALGWRAPDDLAAGSTIVIWWAWLASTAAQIEDHLANVEYTITVDGGPTADWRDHQDQVLDQGNSWAVHWYVPHPRSLAAGEHRIEYRASWRAPIFDGQQYYGPGTAQEIESGSCTFTVREANPS